jgi:hypothetical protein
VFPLFDRSTNAVRPPASKGQARLYAPFLDYVFCGYSGEAFLIRFWDDSIWYSGAYDGVFAIHLRNEDAWNVLAAMTDDFSIGAQYVLGDLRPEGDLDAAVRSISSIERMIQSDSSPAIISAHKVVNRFIENLVTLLRLEALQSYHRVARL